MAKPISHKTAVGILRSKLKISTAQMAKRVGVGQVTIEKIEQGRLPLSRTLATKLAYAYRVDKSDLLAWLQTTGVKPLSGISASGIWTNAGAIEFRTRINPAAKAEAEESMLKLKSSVKDLLKKAENDEHCFQVIIDMEEAVKKIGRKYYPTPEGKQPSRKRRQKA